MSQSVTEHRAVDEAGVKQMQITVSHQGNGKYNITFRRVVVEDGFFSTSLLKPKDPSRTRSAVCKGSPSAFPFSTAQAFLPRMTSTSPYSWAAR